MQLNEQDITKIAELSKLSFDKQQTSEFAGRLSDILTLAGQMDAVDTDGIEPMAHPRDLSQPLRKDEVTEPNQRETFQAIAPKVSTGLYLVPVVID